MIVFCSASIDFTRVAYSQLEMSMDSAAKRQRRLRLTTIVMLVLALFSWGVEYKISLYDIPAEKSVGVPQAKLLSQKERPTALYEATSNDLTILEQPVLLFFCALLSGLASLASHSGISAFLSSNLFDTVRRDRQPGFSFFFFRPPPVFAPSK